MARTSKSKPRQQPRRKRTAPREMERHPVIDNTEPLSTEEVGEILNVPPERVREIQKFAEEWFEKRKNSKPTQ